MISLHPTQPSHADDISALLDRAFGPGFRARTAERLREALLRASRALSLFLAVAACVSQVSSLLSRGRM